MALKREAPTPKQAGIGLKQTNWREIFDDLRETPWEWAPVGVFPMSYVTRIKAGTFAGSEPDEFEATVRDSNRATQRGTLYVRYVGVPNPEEETEGEEETE